MPVTSATGLQQLLWRAGASLLWLACAACVAPPAVPAQQQVAARLAGYEEVMRRMNFDQAANFFTVTGQVSHADAPPIAGREAIRAFLKSFAAYKVLAYHLTVDSTQADGDSATQAGTYTQTVTLPQGNTVQVSGLFETAWQREADGQWRLARMHTMPPVAK